MVVKKISIEKVDAVPFYDDYWLFVELVPELWPAPSSGTFVAKAEVLCDLRDQLVHLFGPPRQLSHPVSDQVLKACVQTRAVYEALKEQESIGERDTVSDQSGRVVIASGKMYVDGVPVGEDCRPPAEEPKPESWRDPEPLL